MPAGSDATPRSEAARDPASFASLFQHAIDGTSVAFVQFVPSAPSALDRLARALAPYAGILTVSTCGSTGECPPSERARVLAAPVTTGDIAIETSLDGRIAVPFTRNQPVVDGEWRCEVSLFGRAERSRSDTAVVALATTAQVSCTNSRPTTAPRFMNVSVPLVDLRDATPGERTVAAQWSAGSYGVAGSQCAASSNATVRIAVEREAGGIAAAPGHVTPDFVRELTIEASFDGSTPPNGATTSSCTADLRGRFSLRARLDPESFTETEANACL